MRQFARGFPTYASWAAGRKSTPYNLRISRAHVKYPKATLAQLRGHTPKGKTPLRTLKPRGLPSGLTPREKGVKAKALRVISQMRNTGDSLAQASRDNRISPNTVRRYTNAVKKEDGRWVAKKYDRIPRKMAIDSDGDSYYITVTDSRHASLIARYHSAKGKFFETGDESYLKQFEGKQVRDQYGNWHTLETDPDTLYELNEQKETEEFFSIYGE